MDNINKEMNDLVSNEENIEIIIAPEPPEDFTGEIYMIVNKITNKKYIGQTKSHILVYNKVWKKFGYKGRWEKHISEAKDINKTYDLFIDIRKYKKTDWEVSLLHKCNKDELNYYESKFIEENNTLSPNGYNMVGGGATRNVISEITKEKLSKKSSEYYSKPENVKWLSNTQSNRYDKEKFDKLESIIDKVKYCKISLQNSTLRGKSVKRIVIVFYNKKNTRILNNNGNAVEISYGGTNTSIEESIVRNIKLFDSFEEKIRIQFSDEEFKTTYNEILKEYESIDRSVIESTEIIEPVENTEIIDEDQDSKKIIKSDLAKIDMINIIKDKISYCKITTASRGEIFNNLKTLTVSFYCINNSRLYINKLSCLSYSNVNGNMENMLIRINNLLNTLDKKITVQFDDLVLKEQYDLLPNSNTSIINGIIDRNDQIKIDKVKPYINEIKSCKISITSIKHNSTACKNIKVTFYNSYNQRILLGKCYTISYLNKVVSIDIILEKIIHLLKSLNKDIAVEIPDEDIKQKYDLIIL
jgi:hypothetical protein